MMKSKGKKQEVYLLDCCHWIIRDSRIVTGTGCNVHYKTIRSLS